jgi:hypothetical protein
MVVATAAATPGRKLTLVQDRTVAHGAAEVSPLQMRQQVLAALAVVAS